MKPLQYLPVWVIVRLCTDEDAVVNYWNDIDGQLELDIDLLDDFCAEATEVHENNKWLWASIAEIKRVRNNFERN